MRRFALIVAASISFIYAGDYAWVRLRILTTHAAYGVVKVRPYYAVRQKNGKDELYFLPSETQVCVQSLFPHFGHNPCWYVNRKKVERIAL